MLAYPSIFVSSAINIDDMTVYNEVYNIETDVYFYLLFLVLIGIIIRHTM